MTGYSTSYTTSYTSKWTYSTDSSYTASNQYVIYQENNKMFKAGDRVRIKIACPNNGTKVGEIYTLTSPTALDGAVCTCTEKWELLDNQNTMNIKEKFVLALTKEPQKSFRKAGITNGDDLLTTDGTQIFLSWLLHSKFADEFKKDIVSDLLKEKEEEDKNK